MMYYYHYYYIYDIYISYPHKLPQFLLPSSSSTPYPVANVVIEPWHVGELIHQGDATLQRDDAFISLARGLTRCWNGAKCGAIQGLGKWWQLE